VWQQGGGEISQASTRTRGAQQAHARAGFLPRHHHEEQRQGARRERSQGRTRTLGKLGLLLALFLLLVVSGMLFSSCSSASFGALLAEGHEQAPTSSSSSSTTEQPAAGGASAVGEREEVLIDAHRKLPLSFVENAGQIEEEAVRYYAQGADYGFFFTPKGAMLSFFSEGNELQQQRGTALALSFLGANPHTTLEVRERLSGTVNYLIGEDPKSWHTGLPTHGELLYRGLWPGIDMVVSGEGASSSTSSSSSPAPPPRSDD
jgi:hypothetical protein